MVIEELLQFFVCEVYTELLKPVKLKEEDGKRDEKVNTSGNLQEITGRKEIIRKLTGNNRVKRNKKDIFRNKNCIVLEYVV